LNEPGYVRTKKPPLVHLPVRVLITHGAGGLFTETNTIEGGTMVGVDGVGVGVGVRVGGGVGVFVGVTVRVGVAVMVFVCEGVLVRVTDCVGV